MNTISTVILGMLLSKAPPPAPASGAPTWAVALIGVGAAIVGALIAGAFRLAGDRADRRAAAQRDALYALQVAGLKLRIALQKYGSAGPRPSVKTTEKLDGATGRFDLLVERVACEIVRNAARDWLTVGQRYWTSDPDTTLAHEEAAWRLLQHHVGIELRRLDD